MKGGGDRCLRGCVVTKLVQLWPKWRGSSALWPAVTLSGLSSTSSHNTEEGQASCQMPPCACASRWHTYSTGWPQSGQLQSLVVQQKPRRKIYLFICLFCFKRRNASGQILWVFVGFLEVVAAFKYSQIRKGSSAKAGKWAAGEAVVEARLWSEARERPM